MTQIPALIISVAAGLLVTKAGIDGAADKALAKQLAVLPGRARHRVGVRVRRRRAAGHAAHSVLDRSPARRACWRGGLRKANARGEAAAAAAPPPTPRRRRKRPPRRWRWTTCASSWASALLPLINDVQGRRLTDQIKALRKTLAQEFGFVMPSVRILDNVQLRRDAYAIRVREMEAGDGKLKIGALLAMDPTGAGVAIPGEAVKEPAFGLDAMWIDERAREEASFRGYTVVDPATVLATHLTEIIKEHMAELLTFAEVKKLIKDLPKETQTLLDDVAPAHISWSGVQRVLQNLLKERVSIRDLAAIVEAIAEAAPAMHDLVLITEHVRGAPGAPDLPPAPQRRRRAADHHALAGLGAGVRRSADRRRPEPPTRARAVEAARFRRRRARRLRARRARWARRPVLLTSPADPPVRALADRTLPRRRPRC